MLKEVIYPNDYELEKLEDYSDRTLDAFILEIDQEYNDYIFNGGDYGNYHKIGAKVANQWGVEYNQEIINTRNNLDIRDY